MLNDLFAIFLEKKQTWTCHGKAFFKQNTTCGACNFSRDGSILAVAFNNVLTLWEPDGISLRFSQPFNQDIRYLIINLHSCLNLR